MERWEKQHTFLSFTQTDICASGRQVTQTLVVTGVLVVVVGHDCFSSRCLFPSSALCDLIRSDLDGLMIFRREDGKGKKTRLEGSTKKQERKGHKNCLAYVRRSFRSSRLSKHTTQARLAPYDISGFPRILKQGGWGARLELLFASTYIKGHKISSFLQRHQKTTMRSKFESLTNVNVGID